MGQPDAQIRVRKILNHNQEVLLYGRCAQPS